MIRINGLSCEMMMIDIETVALWDIAKQVKEDFGTPVSEQIYYNGTSQISKSSQIEAQAVLTMVRVQVECYNCGRKLDKHPLCAQCLDANYCDETCQREDWKTHRKVCKRMKKEEPDDHEHNYIKVFPNGMRDNNEFDLKCTICGKII